MNLHLDIDAFGVLIDDVHKRTGYRTDVLEKDYYVVLMLKELATMQEEGLSAYFKGGTALYKALKMTNRFSEDIDLSVDIRDCESRTQADKRLEKATKKYRELPRDSKQGYSHKSEVVAIYTYEPITEYDKDDTLQRFGKLKIEGTTFTISEPVEELEVSAMLFDLATEEQKKILIEMYGVAPFKIKTITMERIFIDKLFAAEAYVRKSNIDNRAFEAAKHIYDLAVISHHPKVLALLENDVLMEQLLSIRMTEERERLDGIPGVLPKDFVFFEAAKDDIFVRKAYETMQRQYVLRESDRIDFEFATSVLADLKQSLWGNMAWRNCCEKEQDLSLVGEVKKRSPTLDKANNKKRERNDRDER